MQTELAQKVVPPITDALDAPAPGDRVDPIAPTSIGPDAEHVRRRSLAPLVVVLLALLVTAIAIYLALAGKPGAHARDAGALATAPQDAPIPKIAVEPQDAAVAIADAEVVVAIPSDAPVSHHTRNHRDAGVVAVPIDAPVGTAIVSIKSSGHTYSTISIDGGIPMNPPVNNHKLPAGHHVIRFIDPEHSTVLDTQAIDLADGQQLAITQH
jgi:hypothetical protein